MERLTDAEIAELRALRHSCKGSLPPCECHVPEDLGDNGKVRDAAMPMLQRLLDEVTELREQIKQLEEAVGWEAKDAADRA